MLLLCLLVIYKVVNWKYLFYRNVSENQSKLENTAFFLVNIHASIELYALIFPEKDTSNSTPITSLSNNPLLKSQLVCFFAAMRCNHFVFAKCEHSWFHFIQENSIWRICSYSWDLFRVLTVIWVGTVKTHQTSELRDFVAGLHSIILSHSLECSLLFSESLWKTFVNKVCCRKKIFTAFICFLGDILC